MLIQIELLLNNILIKNELTEQLENTNISNNGKDSGIFENIKTNQINSEQNKKVNDDIKSSVLKVIIIHLLFLILD